MMTTHIIKAIFLWLFIYYIAAFSLNSWDYGAYSTSSFIILKQNTILLSVFFHNISVMTMYQLRGVHLGVTII